MMNELFARPHFLWWLLLVPLLLWPLRHSLARMTPPQRRVCFWMRVLLLLLLILALAGLRLPWESDRLSVVFAIDRSASITPEAQAQARAYVSEALRHQRRGDHAALLGFAGDAGLLPKDPAEAWSEPQQPNATDPAQAIALARALFVEGHRPRLVLLSDGYDTRQRAGEAAAVLGAAGVGFDVVPLRNPERPEALVERFTLPDALREGEPFDATALLRSNRAGTATARLYANGFLSGEQEVTLAEGETTVTFLNLQPATQSTTYELEIVPEHDTVVENNRASATALQRGASRVLIVDPAPEQLHPLRDALAKAKITAELRPLAGLPKTLDDLQRYDVLMLSDVAALHLSRAQMELYVRWVNDFGGGFAMLGGENSFGSGGYYKTPLDPILPVRAEHDDRAETPTVAVMIVLDSSGSMSAPVAGQTKMALANQGAALALEVLQPKDLLGVTAVDSRVHEVIPLARHPHREEVKAAILRVTAGGGGIYVYTGLLDAYARLRETNATIRHIILFSDASDAEEKAAGEMADGSNVPGTALDLVSTMATARITTSTVALGLAGDKDTEFLKQLAANGNGRFYLTGDALSLPQIFTTETMRIAQSSLMEEPVAVVAGRDPAGTLRGIDWKEAPLLLGYNLTRLKPTADLLLASERGDPILATWRAGLGRVAAFSSDAKSRWASEWLDWPGYGQFWSQLVRSLQRREGEEGGGLAVATRRVDDNTLALEIDALSAEGSFRNGLNLQVGALLPDGTRQMATARQSAPGRYEAQIAIAPHGTTWLQLSSPQLPGSGKAFGFTPSYPAEFLHNGTDEAALKNWSEAAGGRFNPPPEAVFAPPEHGVRRYNNLAPWLLGAAILLLPLDIWLRRRSWGGVA